MAQFRISIFSFKTVPIDLKLTRFPSRYFGLCFCGTSLNVMPQRFQSKVLAEVSKNDQKEPPAWSV